MAAREQVILCPGQGAQAVGMGRAWCETAPAAAAVFREADEILGDSLGAPLSEICFDGPPDRINRTDVSQPAIYTCSVACFRALDADGDDGDAKPAIRATAGLSLGEYTALHLAGVFDFARGLRLVAKRGALMQESAEASAGGMIALIGADETQAEEVCRAASGGGGDRVLVPANFNAPGQIVLSGHAEACARAAAIAEDMGLRASVLAVAGAFHSPLMQPAADRMRDALAGEPFQNPNREVWSNVTAEPHDPDDLELLKERLVQQIVSPVKWAQICSALVGAASVDPAVAPSFATDSTDAEGPVDAEGGRIEFIELAPGSVLRGLMRRVDKKTRVTSHDEPRKQDQP